MDPITERRLLGQGWTSRLLQSLLLDLLTRTASVSQVEAARQLYATRRHHVVEALSARGIAVPGRDGLNIWMPVVDETAAVVRLASRGIGVATGGPFTVRPGDPPHVRITVGLIADDHDAVARELADASVVGAWTSPR
jgi:DNA-binding transcriptional MocR family regulator